MTRRRKFLKSLVLLFGVVALVAGLLVVILLNSDPQRNGFAFIVQMMAGRRVETPPPGFSGPWRTWYKSGRLASEVTYQKGERKGPFVVWYPNGQKKSQGTLIKSVPYDDVPGASTPTYDGILMHWYPDGKVLEVANFQDGQFHGKVETWDDSDKGYWKRSEENYQSGKLHGVSVRWDPPGVRTEITYSNGLRHGWGRQVSEQTGKVIWEEYRENDQALPRQK